MSLDLSVYKNFFDEFNLLVLNSIEKRLQEWQQFFADYKLINQELLKQKQPIPLYDKIKAENFFDEFAIHYKKWQSMGYNFNIF